MTVPRRVVVTGVGMVTPIGTGRREFWSSLLAGKTGFAPVRSFDTSRYGVHLGAEIPDFRPEDFVRRLNPASLGRSSQLAIAAARMALEDASLDLASIDLSRAGVCAGTTSGEPQFIERFDEHYVHDQLERVGREFITRYPCHVVPAHVAQELGFGGEIMMIPTACAAGNYAIAHAGDLLRMGRASIMLAGGADSFSRISYTGFARLGAIAPEVCRPFDRNRKGMVPGEGAAMLVLERKEQAMARGARIYCELAGYGLSCDAHHMTSAQPDGSGACRAMRMALERSQLAPKQVDYISAHGTGTVINDRIETMAVKQTFGKHAYEIPMSSVKSMLGHTMGAASAIEASVCALAIAHGQVPPTMNWQEQDPECDLDYVPNRARNHKVGVALNNAYAFGGNNSSLIFASSEV